jgi:hypothetical protein
MYSPYKYLEFHVDYIYSFLYILIAIAMKGVSKPLGVRSIIAVCYRT